MKILNKNFLKFDNRLQIYFISIMKIFKISNEYLRISPERSLKTPNEYLRISLILVFILCLQVMNIFSAGIKNLQMILDFHFK